MPSAALVKCLELVPQIGSALAAQKLFAAGLHRKYRFLFAYLVFLVPYYSLVLLLDENSQLYLKFWVLTTPVFWVFYVGAVLELYGLILAKHKGLYTLGRWVMYAAIAMSILISILSFLPQLPPASQQHSSIMPYILPIERGVDFSLAIFILLMLLFLRLYPVPLSRNVVVHTVIYSIFFLSNTLGLLLRQVLGPQAYDQVNLFLMGIFATCVVAWLVFLNARGEEVQLTIASLRPEYEENLLRHLDALNDSLLRVSGN